MGNRLKIIRINREKTWTSASQVIKGRTFWSDRQTERIEKMGHRIKENWWKSIGKTSIHSCTWEKSSIRPSPSNQHCRWKGKMGTHWNKKIGKEASCNWRKEGQRLVIYNQTNCSVRLYRELYIIFIKVSSTMEESRCKSRVVINDQVYD